VYAQETPKAQTCQEQLTDVTVQAYNLDVDRDTKERALAKSQAQVYSLQNQVVQLQKQVAVLQKAVAPKAEEQGK
jgi:hypothetical protein